MTNPPDGFIDSRGTAIAYRRAPAPGGTARAGVMWLNGLKSHMDGTKAMAVADWARARDRSCVRFDYSGHGRSGGRFEDGTIGRWLAESQAVFDSLTEGPQILAGSSLGGWIAMLLMREHVATSGAAASRIRGLLLVAPATDMTKHLILADAGHEARRAIESEGVYLRPSRYGDGPYPITRRLIEDGRRHLILGSDIVAPCPVHILHGLDDPEVPWRHSLELVHCLKGSDIALTCVKGGDHRLSRPGDLTRMAGALDELARKADPSP